MVEWTNQTASELVMHACKMGLLKLGCCCFFSLSHLIFYSMSTKTASLSIMV